VIRDRRLVAAVAAAAGLGLLYAALSAYWAAGGTWLVATVGGPVEQLAGRGGLLPVVVAGGAALAKAVGAGLGLVLLARPVHRLLRRAVTAMGLLLTVYGGLLVVVGALSLAGVFGAPAADPAPLRWHVAVWDAWFLLWGVLVLAAVLRRRRLDRVPG
jgi:hypothetical protein